MEGKKIVIHQPSIIWGEIVHMACVLFTQDRYMPPSQLLNNLYLLLSEHNILMELQTAYVMSPEHIVLKR